MSANVTYVFMVIVFKWGFSSCSLSWDMGLESQHYLDKDQIKQNVHHTEKDCDSLEWLYCQNWEIMKEDYKFEDYLDKLSNII